MRILASFTAALLFMFLLASGPSFAQDDKPDHPQDQQQKDKDKDTKSKPDAKQDEKTRQDETKRDESRPEGKQDNARPESARPEEGRPENARPEAARPQEQEQNRPEQRDEHAVRPQEQARPEQGGNARPMQAGRGQRIPEDRFRAHFGREHHFHVQRAEIVNQSQPQVVYGGYTFVLQQPWPAEWSYDDDCYIDYVDDNYYLYDVDRPGIQILVFVIG